MDRPSEDDPRPAPGDRVLVFLVAYEAQAHITSVLDRVPAELWNDLRVHFLCIDDASSDRSAVLASAWVAERGIKNATVLRNPVNQGYGGNQKLGYRLAVEGGFAFTILMHADGQYAPELLPRFISSWETTGADVIMGSRTQGLRSTERGGVPLHQMLGTRTLTRFQNLLTGQRLSGYHTGYRAYSTRFLRQVPFEANSNDLHFDTEILLQALHVGAQVVELPIPTHYGDRARRVGVQYAHDVVAATLQYKMHQMGMLCSLRYRDLTPEKYRDKTELVYSSHRLAVDLVKALAPRSVLDIGGGPGYVARRCTELGAQVTGIDMAAPLPRTMDRFIGHDLEHGELPEDPSRYDVVLLLDVLEHLTNPEEFLVSLRNHSRALDSGQPHTRLLVSTPNVAFAAIRLNLLLGRFSYAERGILDITHKRLFTRKALLQTLSECGYRIERVLPVGAPFEAVLPGLAGRALGSACAKLARLWPTLFAFQFMVVCTPLPGIRQVLRHSKPYTLSENEFHDLLGR